MMIPAGLALIFDMDGVILDSNPIHREAWRLYNQRFGIATDEAMQQFMYGKRNDEIVRDFFGADLAPEAVAAHGAGKESLYREMMSPRLAASLVPGVTDFCCAATELPPVLPPTPNPPMSTLFSIECGSGIRPCGRVSRPWSTGIRSAGPKPDPEVYLRAAGLLGVDPRNCVVFEDSHTGVEAARASGARVVALRTTHKEFKNVDLTVDDFRSPELEKWLEAQKPV